MPTIMGRTPVKSSEARMDAIMKILKKIARGLLFILHLIYRQRTIYLYELRPARMKKNEPAVDYQFGQAEDAAAGGHIDAMKRVQFYDPVELARRKKLGDVCYTATVANRVVGFCWMTNNQRYISEIAYTVRLEAGTAWVYACAVDPDFRGKGVYPAMLGQIGESLFGHGILRIRIDVESDNTASISGIEKAGFRRRGHILWQRIFGKEKIRFVYD